MLSKKLQDLVSQAETAGLKVEIKTGDSKIVESYSIVITSGFSREDYKPQTLMQQMLQWDTICILAHRYNGDGKPRAFKIRAFRSNAFCNLNKPIKKVKDIEFWISLFGKDVDKFMKQPTAA